MLIPPYALHKISQEYLYLDYPNLDVGIIASNLISYNTCSSSHLHVTVNQIPSPYTSFEYMHAI